MTTHLGASVGNIDGAVEIEGALDGATDRVGVSDAVRVGFSDGADDG